MIVYALICEAYSDDERLLGIYSDRIKAEAAYIAWEDSGLYPFVRIEARELDGAARERDLSDTVFETGGEE